MHDVNARETDFIIMQDVSTKYLKCLQTISLKSGGNTSQ